MPRLARELDEGEDYLGEVSLRDRSLALGLLDILSRNEVRHHRDEAGVLDSFGTARRIVNRDSSPENLPEGSESAPGRIEAFVEFVDLVSKKATDRGTEGSWKFDVQQMRQTAHVKVLRSLVWYVEYEPGE